MKKQVIAILPVHLKKRLLQPAGLWMVLACLTLWPGEAPGQTKNYQTNGFRFLDITPGGISPLPFITNLVAGTSLRLDWFGFQGPYQVQASDDLMNTNWSNVGDPVNGNSTTFSVQSAAAFFRVKGEPPVYAGYDVCLWCHESAHEGWQETRHANAFATLQRIGQHTNPSCLPCHTVGYGISTGYIDTNTTPALKNVQCENCHGPGGAHVDSALQYGSPRVFPIKTRSAMLCGGCHNDFHHPTYEEWTTSAHAEVVPSLANDFASTNRNTAVSRMSSCGACHSGAVRLEMLGAYYRNLGNFRGQTNVNWPTGAEASTTPQTCIVCHDSHGEHTYTNILTGVVYTNQLRHPLTSTNFFSYNTGTNFAGQFNPAVNVCGQCHNARGATVGSTSRPPHHSPQYNIFLGSIGITATTGGTAPPQGAHKDNPRQCAGCHTHGHGETNPTPEDPVYTGHSFRYTVEACMVCHTSPTGPSSATNRLFTVQAEVSASISNTKSLLDLWALTKNTNSWASKYNARGWEYTSPGELSNPTGSPTVTGPTSSEQAQIPQPIKDARFNVYLVTHDQSKGIHNAPYIRHLLTVAQQKVIAELSK